MKSDHNYQSASTIILIAVWFGLATGIVEAVIFIISQKLGQMVSLTHEILWVAPMVDLMIFILAGLVLVVASLFFSKLPVVDFAVYSFTFMAFLAWTLAAFFEDLANYAILILALGLTITFIRFYRKNVNLFQQFWRRSLPWIVATTLLIFVAIQGGSWLRERILISRLPSSSADTPNFLVIVVDALRADRLGSYGYHRQTSPNIDRLAQEGVLFENAISSTAYTLPSHASIMTGVPTSQHGVEWYSFNALFKYSGATIAEVLQRLGYRTAAFSANTFWVTREQGFGRGFIHFEDYFQSLADMFLRPIYGRMFERIVLRNLGFEDIPARIHASDINRNLLDWVKKDKDKPYFIFINYLDSHDPYISPQPYRSMFSKIENPGGLLNSQIGQDGSQLTPEELQSESDAYDGAIAYVDVNISQLLESLQKFGLLKNTVVTVTSDHGEAFGEHGVYLHGNSLYREEIHIPLIIWAPGRVPAGLHFSQPVSIESIPATLLDLNDPTIESPFQAPPLTWLWDGHTQGKDWPNPVSEIAQQDWRSSEKPVSHGWIKSIFSPQWHYIKYETLPSNLFAWRDDPLESDNLAGQPKIQELIGKLNEELFNFLGLEKSSKINLP